MSDIVRYPRHVPAEVRRTVDGVYGHMQQARERSAYAEQEREYTVREPDGTTTYITERTRIWVEERS